MGQIRVSDAQIDALKICLRHGHVMALAMPWYGPWHRPLEVVAQVGLDTKVRGVF